MKKTVFSNIGNRNIKYHNKFIIDYIKENDIKTTTFDFTKNLYENFNDEKQNITPVIFNMLLEKVKEEIDQTVFFCSQQTNTRNNQDTYYIGKILVKLFQEKYPYINFSTEVLKCSVIDHNQLIRTFQKYFLNYKEEHPGKKVIYCDAGGTSQQKFAVKIILEYLFPEEQLQVYYISQKEKNISEIVDGTPYEYRKIIDKQNIEILTKKAYYKSALKIWDGTILNKKERTVSLLIKFADFRKNLLLDEAKNIAKNLSINKITKNNKIIINFNNKIPLGNFNKFNEFINKEHFFNICEILSLAQFNFQNDNFEQAVLNLIQFEENYLYALMQNNFGYNLYKSYYNEIRKLINDVPEKFKNAHKVFGDKIEPGIPLLIIVGENIQNKCNAEILNIFKASNSYLTKNIVGIDSFRNSYVHKGKAIDTNILKEQAYYKKIFNFFNLFELPDKNIYDQTNEEIINLLH